MSKYKPILQGPSYDGQFKKYEFENGYGASVISHRYSYGGPKGKWELAIIGPDGNLNYETHITNDVIGHLEWYQVEILLDQIASLPEVKQSEPT